MLGRRSGLDEVMWAEPQRWARGIIIRRPESLLPLSLFIHHVRIARRWPGGVVTRTRPYWCPDLGLLASRTVRNVLLFQPPSLWNFVMAV